MRFFSTLSDGAVVEDAGECTCPFPDYGDMGYSQHEPFRGLLLLGYLPEEAAVMHGFAEYPEPNLLPTMLWDFGGLK